MPCLSGNGSASDASCDPGINGYRTAFNRDKLMHDDNDTEDELDMASKEVITIKLHKFYSILEMFVTPLGVR